MIFKALWDTFVWFIRMVRYENLHNYLNYQNRDNGIIILANGPSLKRDIELVLIHGKRMDYCVVNDFCQSSFFERIKPVYYVLADPMYFNEKWQHESEKKTIEMLICTSWNMSLFIPYKYFSSNIVGQLSQNKLLKIVPFHANGYVGIKKIRYFLYERGLAMPRIQNVLIPTIFNMVNMGYCKIYLFGVEHSWTKNIMVNDDNQVCLANDHFYTLEQKPTPWKKCNGEQYRMHEILRDLAYMFEGYHLLQEYAVKEKCKIFNMTEDSFIDAFNRKNIKGNEEYC